MTRNFVCRAGVMALGILVALGAGSIASAGIYNLEVAETTINVSGENHTAMTINGTVPGPVLRFKEGEELTINVTNKMDEDTSIHWHGLILPFQQDGVPRISFPGSRSLRR